MAFYLKRLYENAIDVEYSGLSYTTALHQFESLKDYKDSADHALYCRRMAELDQSDHVKERMYNSAVELQLDGYYSCAETKFELLAAENYRHSRRHLEECRQALEKGHTIPAEPQAAQFPQPDSLNEESIQARRPVLRAVNPGPWWEYRMRRTYYRTSSGMEAKNLDFLTRHFTICISLAFLFGVILSGGIAAMLHFVL